MLLLQRRRGQKVYIGDKPLTVIDFTHATLTIEWEGSTLTLPRGVETALDPNTVIKYGSRRSFNTATIFFKSKDLILREEAYNNVRL